MSNYNLHILTKDNSFLQATLDPKVELNGNIAITDTI